MNVFRAVGVAVWAWISAAQCLPLIAVWFPVLLLGLLEAGALAFLIFFHHPLVAGAGEPAVVLLAGEAATHYPEHLLALPGIAARMRLGLGVAVGSLLLAVATLRFAAVFGWHRPGRAWGIALRAAPHLWLLAALPLLAHWGVASWFRTIPEEVRAVSTIVKLGMLAAHQVVAVVMAGLLLYATAWVVLKRRAMWSATAASIGMAARTPVITVLLVAVPAALMFPLVLVLSGLKPFAVPMAPETVAILVGVQTLVGMLLNVFLVGAVARVFVLHVGADA